MKAILKKSIFVPWLIVGLGALYYCYEYFLRITPSVITPELMRDYNLTGAQVGNLAAFYYHAYVPMQIVVGLLMDRYGPRRLLTLACILCAMGTYLFAGTHNLMVAQAGRFLVGFGSAFAFVGALKLATIWLPPNRFALVSGIVMCLGMIGGLFGDIWLERMVTAMGWQETIFLSAIAGVFLSAVIWSIVRDKNPYMIQPYVHMIDSRELFLGLKDALKNPQIWINGIIGLLLYLSLSVFAELWGISYLEQGQSLTSEQAANANSMVFFGWAVGAPFWGWFSDYIRRRVLPIMVGSFISLIFVTIILYVPHLSFNTLRVFLFLFGFASSVQILIFAVCYEVSHIKIAGTAIALTNMIIMVSGNIFQPLVGKILDSEWTGAMSAGARIYPPYAYKVALSVLPISIVVAMVLIFFIRETYVASHSNGHHPTAL